MYHRWLRVGSTTPVQSLARDSGVQTGAMTTCVCVIKSWERKKPVYLPIRGITSGTQDFQGGERNQLPRPLGIDPELELLPSKRDTQGLGSHELKTSPLATRDVIDSGKADFVQRGLLGEVLSVHADNITQYLKDPRVYMNLDAPSSGLVCGVQGSGKSHTVSCIMESALITDPRVGTLPAPLATVVFHYDQEISNRSCEAAFLSELNDGSSKGVQDVVVLVSPNNKEQRMKVYSHLKHVRVESLRIAERDLNAERMLSMMGVDSQETTPLYVQSALSILREPGFKFTYKKFRSQLRKRDFNKSQSGMLQLRLDLLDSFLHGKGQDIPSFFGPGKLLIIDLSDRFIDDTTATMLFDICLGLFMEWEPSTAKLLVLDEAHKYLSSSTSSQLTKRICSIIRQQRHLSTRVVISTQEPTVVPVSVLDLLPWIICHRFSSPSWVRHLDRHVCVNERNPRSEGSTRWDDRVMTLRTGEAILFSPESLFLSTKGALSTLSTGYSVIRSRLRLTRDGGMSLMATDGVDIAKGVSRRVKSGSPEPKVQAPQGIPPAVMQLQSTQRPDPGKKSSISPPTASKSSTTIVTDALASVTPPSKFAILVGILTEMSQKTGKNSHPYSDIHRQVLAKHPETLSKGMKWKAYIKSAEQSRIVQVNGEGSVKMLTLALPYRKKPTSPGGSKKETANPSIQTPKRDKDSSKLVKVHKKFEILISLMNRLSSVEVPHVSQSIIGAELAKSSSTGVRGLGYKNVKKLLTAAQEAGVIQLDSKVAKKEQFWRLSISFMQVSTHR